MAVKTILGACPLDCPDTCSMLVTVDDGKVTGVQGNPDHPFTRGHLCVKMNDYQTRVNSADRVLHPMRRCGPKGSGQFERIGWDDALLEIKHRWRRIIDEHGAKAIVPCSYLGTEGITNGLNVGDPFFNRLGATIAERTYCDSGSITAYAMTIGDSAAVDPESAVHSKYIILWACNVLSTNSHFWPFVAEAQKCGAKVVVIDPCRTKTAKQADWHIPIRPGTDGALALGLMQVIIAEGLTDDDYIDQYTVGYDELKTRVASFTPQRVSDITGIPAEDIEKLAREYAKAHAPLIRIGVAIERHAGGGQTVRALSCLPALVGAWRHPGGGLLQLPIWAFPVNWGHLMRPDLLPEGEPQVLNLWKLGQALCGEHRLPTPIRSLMVYNSNPLITCPEQDKMLQGLEREDLFTVVSEHFVTDTAKYADIVLPATTQVEQEDIMFSWGHLYISYNNRAVEPLGEAVSNTELFRRLAKAMGFDDDPFFTRTDEELIEQSVLWDSPMLEGITLELLKGHGFARLNLPLADRYAPHAAGEFKTPSGKCEFKSSAAAGGNFVLPLFRQGYDGQQSGEPVDPLPHYIAPNESLHTARDLAARYPLSLVSPKSHAFLSSSFGNMPRQQRHARDQTLVMHPDDAKARLLTSGQKARIFNGRGAFEAIVTVTDDVMRGVVLAPVGYWRSELFANRATVHAVTSSAYADLGRAPTFSDILVEVEAMA